jgi:hypothetical protein
MGPVLGGYNLTTLPHSWDDAKVLRVEIDKIWRKLTKLLPQAGTVLFLQRDLDAFRHRGETFHRVLVDADQHIGLRVIGGGTTARDVL